MQVEEIAARALAASSGIGLGSIDSREITAEQRATLEAQLLTPDLYVDATSELSVSQLRPKIRQLKAKTGALPAAVFVDYLQLLESPEGFRASSLYETTTAISKQLKRLAMELDLPVVALAQLNRESEKRPGAPALYDLKDSGSIEQDADVVILLSEDKQRRLSLSVSKNRQGPRGSLTGEVNRATMTVRNLVRD
jgi:replicative DNA helicase